MFKHINKILILVLFATVFLSTISHAQQRGARGMRGSAPQDLKTRYADLLGDWDFNFLFVGDKEFEIKISFMIKKGKLIATWEGFQESETENIKYSRKTLSMTFPFVKSLRSGDEEIYGIINAKYKDGKLEGDMKYDHRDVNFLAIKRIEKKK